MVDRNADLDKNLVDLLNAFFVGLKEMRLLSFCW